jgi:hypothetical protein
MAKPHSKQNEHFKVQLKQKCTHNASSHGNKYLNAMIKSGYLTDPFGGSKASKQQIGVPFSSKQATPQHL